MKIILENNLLSKGNIMQRVVSLAIASFMLLFSWNLPAHAAAKYLFKIASLAPTGSVWIEQFKSFGKEVAEKTGGEVVFRVYAGGVMGDDQAMYRKMRIRQLHGGGFTMTGISAVVPDFRVMAIPFFFETYEEVDYVKNGLIPVFTERFREKGLEFIAMTEVGFVYAMSTKPIASFDDLRKSTNWSPTGDPISETYLVSLGITPVQLSIPDVLSSLQSGLIDTAYNSLYGSIIMQWFTKAKYLVDTPYGYAYGAFVLDSKAFAKLPEKYQQILHTAAKTHFAILLKNTRKSNFDSRKVLKEHGAEFLQADAQTLKILREKRDLTIDKLIPDSFSQDIYDREKTLLEEYRKSTAGGKTN